MDTFRKVLGWLLFFTVAIFLVVFSAIQVLIPNDSVGVFGFKFFLVANTGSMEPDLKANDLIIIKNFDFDSIAVGDYIAFQAVGTVDTKPINLVITHAVIAIIELNDEKSLVTKGINANGYDAKPVTASGANNTHKYIGKYSSKSSSLGTIISFLTSPLGILCVAVDAACIVLGLVMLARKDKKITLSDYKGGQL